MDRKPSVAFKVSKSRLSVTAPQSRAASPALQSVASESMLRGPRDSSRNTSPASAALERNDSGFSSGTSSLGALASVASASRVKSEEVDTQALLRLPAATPATFDSAASAASLRILGDIYKRGSLGALPRLSEALGDMSRMTLPPLRTGVTGAGTVSEWTSRSSSPSGCCADREPISPDQALTDGARTRSTNTPSLRRRLSDASNTLEERSVSRQKLSPNAYRACANGAVYVRGRVSLSPEDSFKRPSVSRAASPQGGEIVPANNTSSAELPIEEASRGRNMSSKAATLASFADSHRAAESGRPEICRSIVWCCSEIVADGIQQASHHRRVKSVDNELCERQ